MTGGAPLTPQEAVRRAMAAYEKGTAAIGSFAATVEQVAAGRFSAGDALKDFDGILQYILLFEAGADGCLSREELDLIATVTRRGDILEIVNRQLDAHLSWEQLVNGNRRLTVDLLVAVSPTFDRLCRHFITYMASADGMIEEIDLLPALTECVREIALCLSHADGRAEPAEQALADNIFYTMFAKTYQQVADEYRRI